MEPFGEGYLDTIAAMIYTLGFPIYIWSILRGVTQPHFVSWLIWSLADGLFFYVYCKTQQTGFFLAGLYFLAGPCAVMALARTKKYGASVTNFDVHCGSIAIALFFSMYFTATSPVLSFVAFLASTLIATIPTILKAYRVPGRESKAAWCLFLFSQFLNLLVALQEYGDYMNIAFTSLMLATSATITMLTVFTRRGDALTTT